MKNKIILLLVLLIPIFSHAISLKVEFDLVRNKDFPNLSRMGVKFVSSESLAYQGKSLNKYPDDKYNSFFFPKNKLSIDKNDQTLKQIKMTLSKLFKKSYDEVNLKEDEIYFFNEFADHIENLFIIEGFEVTHRELIDEKGAREIRYRKILYLKK
jgi:hypothetical protein